MQPSPHPCLSLQQSTAWWKCDAAGPCGLPCTKEAGGGAWMLTSTTACSHWLSMTSLIRGCKESERSASTFPPLPHSHLQCYRLRRQACRLFSSPLTAFSALAPHYFNLVNNMPNEISAWDALLSVSVRSLNKRDCGNIFVTAPDKSKQTW